MRLFLGTQVYNIGFQTHRQVRVFNNNKTAHCCLLLSYFPIPAPLSSIAYRMQRETESHACVYQFLESAREIPAFNKKNALARIKRNLACKQSPLLPSIFIHTTDFILQIAQRLSHKQNNPAGRGGDSPLCVSLLSLRPREKDISSLYLSFALVAGALIIWCAEFERFVSSPLKEMRTHGASAAE
jgi:hypothetical protein